jgi:hypothetical protein
MFFASDMSYPDARHKQGRIEQSNVRTSVRQGSSWIFTSFRNLAKITQNVIANLTTLAKSSAFRNWPVTANDVNKASNIKAKAG